LHVHHAGANLRELTFGKVRVSAVEVVGDDQPQHEMIAVIGPNGAGKTSLLRALAGIELQSGHVAVFGEDVAAAPPARRIRLLSFLPATRALVWPISVRDVIALGLPSADPDRVEELVELLELQAFADRPVNQLSTGERSRVVLARALAARPRLLLLDEPLANLDPYWVLRVLEILGDAIAQEQCAVLASLHDLAQAAAFSRVLLIDSGRLVADAAPKDMMESEELARAFRIEREGTGWRVRTGVSLAADPRSSP
jgi:iron complex transport system ATP-binding protein